MTPSSSTSSVAFTELLYRLDGDQELAREILLMFKEEYPALLRSLHKAGAGREMRQVETTAHTLKGMLANLSAVHALSTATLLEHLGREGDSSRMDEAIARLSKELLDTEQEIDLYLAQTPS
ncbi:MAG: Hpt domain-containing protein [Acidobacteriaceae bacterium]